MRARRQLVEIDGKTGFACGIGFRQVGERLLYRIDLLVGQTELITAEAGAFFRHRDRHLAIEIEVRRRRAVKEAARDVDLGRDFLRDVTGRRIEIELDPIGHVIFHQKRGFANRRPFRIGEGAHMPCAGRRRSRQRQGEAVTAEPLVRDQSAAELNAVGALDDEGERYVERGGALRIAQKRGEVSCLAGAINAALGINKGIESVRRRTAADAAIGEIEGRRLEVEERIVALRIACGQECRGSTALPARQPCLELRVAVRVGVAGGQHFIAPGDEAHIDGALCIGVRQRVDEDVDAVITGERGEAEIGDDEPLRRQRIVIVVDVFQLLRLRHHDVDAGLEIADCLIDRKSGGNVGIERRRLDSELALPYRNAARLAELFDLVAAQTALEVAAPGILAADGVNKTAVAQPVDLDGDRAGVGADDRNAALAGARQHISGGREPRHRLAVAHIDRELGGIRQRLVDRRRQPGAQRHRIGLAVLQSLYAKLLVGRRRRRLVGPGENDERREVGAQRQLFGKLETRARRGGIGIDAVIEHAEAVNLAQPFVLAAHVGHFAQIEREPKRVQRRPP